MPRMVVKVQEAAVIAETKGRFGECSWDVANETLHLHDGENRGGFQIGGNGGPGVSDHGALAGLNDDDHSQYHNDARGDARYYTKSQSDSQLASKADSPAGVPAGGTTGQVLSKNSNTDFDTEWTDATAGGGLTAPRVMAMAFIKL